MWAGAGAGAGADGADICEGALIGGGLECEGALKPRSWRCPRPESCQPPRSPRSGREIDGALPTLGLVVRGVLKPRSPRSVRAGVVTTTPELATEAVEPPFIPLLTTAEVPPR